MAFEALAVGVYSLPDPDGAVDPRLSDPQWLEQVHLGERRTASEIGRLVGANAGVVMAALARARIPYRSATQLRGTETPVAVLDAITRAVERLGTATVDALLERPEVTGRTASELTVDLGYLLSIGVLAKVGERPSRYRLSD